MVQGRRAFIEHAFAAVLALYVCPFDQETFKADRWHFGFFLSASWATPPQLPALCQQIAEMLDCKHGKILKAQTEMCSEPEV